MTERDESRDRPGDEMVRLTVAEAADQLGISEAGVRKRVQRGQIAHERGDDGRVWVWVSPAESRHAESRDEPVQSRDSSADLVPELRDRIRFLERQLEAREDELRRRDVMLLNITEAMKAITPPAQETPSEAPLASAGSASGASETPTEGADGTEPRSDAPGPPGTTQRPWWRRIFGG